MAKIRAIYKDPAVRAKLIEVEDDLHELQMFTGHFQTVPYITEGNVVLCNDDGKLLGMAPNIGIWNDVIFGPLLICGVDGENLTDVTQEAIEASGWLGLKEAEEVSNHAG